ncbi:hypothetical protein [Spirosoma radiotolerans]|uniref:DoxX family protein n=1 Tax=Spirosoma radiotolerans TaxID=1379870 RepID=A0A0E3ZT47_9BACT|nr:hypothetical protein [Spirosoma radiotolerans]AKD53850.1 hypothetical protein SD10_01945 [Spirosoma radiotolerans]
MSDIRSVGRLFYSLGIIAYGIQQIIIKDFRPQILPGFPAWVHEWSVFAILSGIFMIGAGFLTTGLLKVRAVIRKKIFLYLGFYFLVLLLVSHLPYLLFVYPHKLSHLGSWGDALKGLAFSGGAFIMAGSWTNEDFSFTSSNDVNAPLEKLIPLGRLFYCTTIILFGCNHFVYDISAMVPKWFGPLTFWSYFGGAALIGAGAAILLQIWLKPVSLLLATMLFLWFIMLHIPNAIANPYAGRGNAVVSAFDALLFCGTALVLSQSKKQKSHLMSEKAMV